MRNIAPRLIYVGTAYHGWQVQKNAVTVVETLEHSLASVVGHSIKCTGAGRTDAGVHVETCIVNLRTSFRIPCDRIPLAVNTRLPDDIVVIKATEVLDGLNAIGPRLKKEYIYRIYNSHIRDTFYVNRAWFYPKHLDGTVMQRMASRLVGIHDFAAVRSVGTETRTTVRTVHYFNIFCSGELVGCRVCVDGSLYNMVRVMVDTCVYVADGKFSPDDVPVIPEGRNRTAAGPTVPAGGFYMTKLWYQEDVLQLTLLPLCELQRCFYAYCTVVCHRCRHPLRHNVSLPGNEKIILLQDLHKRPFCLCRLYPCRMKSMKEHRTGEINGSRPNAVFKPKKRLNRFVRFPAFLVILALMVSVATLVANYDKLNLDFIKRWFSYRTLARNDNGQAGSFHFVGDPLNAFAVVDGDLLVCSLNTTRLYSGSDQAFMDQAVSMTNPVVSTTGGTALVYNAGGRELFVYPGREEVFSFTQEDGQALLPADVNQNGWLAITSQESGHKGSITVYDNSYSPLVRFSLSNRFMMDAAVTLDNKSVVLLTTGPADSNFESRVDLYRLDRTEEETEPDWTCPVGNNAVLDLRRTSIGIWALGESGLYTVPGDGALSGSYDYGERYLKAFSLDGDGTASLSLGKHQADSTAGLLTINASGEPAATPPVEEQVLFLSAVGWYAGVFTADRLDAYSQDLEFYNTPNDTQNAQKVLQRSGGSATFIDSTTACLYVPQ